MATLIGTLEDRQETQLKHNTGPSPQYTPRASGLDKCARAMYHQILNWEQRPPFSLHALGRMGRGRDIEERIVAPRLAEMGMHYVEAQTSCAIRNAGGDIIVTGHIDGLLDWAGYMVVVEVKSVNPNIWPRLETIQDLLDDTWCWRYPMQLLVYMHAQQQPMGLFILDDCLGHQRYIPLFLHDWEPLVMELILRCDEVVQAVKLREPLPYHDDPAHCNRCIWQEAGVCSPPADWSDQGIGVIASDELELALTTMEETADAKKMHDAANRTFGAAAKARQDGRYICGPFTIEINRSDRKGYEVQPGTVVRKKFERFIRLAEQPDAESAGA